MTTEYEKGFNEAIDRVLHYAKQEAESHARICKELKSKKINSKAFHYKALALIDFKLYIEHLFKCVLSESCPESMPLEST